MESDATVDVFPVRDEDLSPQEFIDLVEKHPSLIERSRIIPPVLGSKGFGTIHVHYSRPRYKALSGFRPIAR